MRERAGTVLAALDLGTNNCRLLIARPERGSFRVIDAFSRLVRLGERVAASGALTEAAMARTLDALGICAQKIRRRAVTHFRGVATQACRAAANGLDFLGEVARRTGLKLDLIGPREEARLAALGCLPLLEPGMSHALLFDIGGGSTEIILLEARDGAWRIAEWRSLGDGVVSVAERFNGRDLAQADYRMVIGAIADQLRPLEQSYRLGPRLADGSAQVIGTSGTVTTLAGVHLALARYSRSAVDSIWLEAGHMDAAIAAIVALSPAGRAQHPCIGAERADLVLPGCAILDGIRAVWPAPRLRVADRGLREGMIVELMRDAGLGPRPPV